MKRFLVLFSMLLVSLSAFAAEQPVVEVIQLKHRTADQVMPLLRPFVAKQGEMAGGGGQIIIRTTPANLRQLKEILRKTDVPLRRLLITVRQNAPFEREAKGASGSVSIGTHTGMSSGGEVVSTRSLEKAEDIQQLRVTEGSRAFIRVGTSIPMPERTIIREGSTVNTVEGVSYRDIAAGFHVLPMTSGERVFLEITAQRDTADAQGNIKLQVVQTSISGRLGEWLEIAGVGQAESEKENGVSYSTSELGLEQRRVLIKVEEAR